MKRRGTILILAMLIIFALASLVLAMARTARVEGMAAANRNATIEASAAEMAAEQYVIGLLANDRDTLDQLTEDNFLAVPVGTGYFWITRPNFGDRSLPDFGLLDESTKTPINGTGYNRLRLLPLMTDEIAASIVDWRDTNDETTNSGVESSYYLSLDPPYNAKNADFESIEELRLIKGVTDELYFGTKGTAIGEVSYGLSDILTPWARVKVTDPNGSDRLNLRGQNIRDALQRLLTEKLDQAKAITYMAALGPPQAPLPQDLFELASRTNMKVEDLEKIEDYVTSLPPPQNGAAQLKVVGNRLNINTAPREMLLTLTAPSNNGTPSLLTSSDIDNLLGKRDAALASNPYSIAWVYDALKEKSAGLGRRVTGRGDVYSADITAVSGNGRAFKHFKVVVDVTGTSPRIIYRHDLTDRGFPLDVSILSTLRSGGNLGRSSIGAN